LVKYGDSEALANLIVEMINNPQKRKQLGQENKKRAHAYFSVEKMIGAYEDLYHSVLQ
jgi:glycosyltransferase involved in cell wall biosynthesis